MSTKNRNRSSPRSVAGTAPKTSSKLPYTLSIITEALAQIKTEDPKALTQHESISLVDALLSPLISNPPPRHPPKPIHVADGESEKHKHARRFLTLLRKNGFKEASRVAESMPTADLNLKNEQQLRRLYPNHEGDQPDMTCPDPASLVGFKINEETLVDTLNHMRSSAPGKSRISVGHLRHILQLDSRIRAAFTNVANIILLGEDNWDDPRLLRLTEARGIGLVKDMVTGKLRPIGVNEAFLNAVARIGLRRFKDVILESLDPMDFGYSRPGGTENILQIVRSLIHFIAPTNKSLVILQLDFENAFNSVFRSAIFERIRTTCPELLPFARFRYKDLQVFFADVSNNFIINSTAGVSQGCPCSPAFFQLVMSDILKEVRLQERSLILSYLDDVTMIFSSPRDALVALKMVRDRAQAVGLKLNLSKCSMYWMQGSGISQDDLTAQDEFSTLGVAISTRGANLLGSFVGSKEFVHEGTLQAFRAMISKVEFLKDVIDTSKSDSFAKRQTFFTSQRLLRYMHWCLNPLPNYLVRTLPPHVTFEPAIGFDHAMAVCLLRLTETTGLQPHPTYTAFKQQVLHDSQRNWTTRTKASYRRLFSKIGGAGLRSASDCRIPAYLGSIALTAPCIQSAFNIFMRQEAPSLGALNLGYEAIETNVKQVVMHFTPAKSPIIFPIFRAEARKGIQRLIGKAKELKELAEVGSLIDKFGMTGPAGASYRSKYRRRAYKYASAWMGVSLSPECKFNLLSNEVVECEIIKSIGEHPPVPKHCAMCKKQLTTETEPSEDHGVGCCAPRNTVNTDGSSRGSSGANASAGGIIERAITAAVKMVDGTITRKPKLDLFPQFQRIIPAATPPDPNDRTKKFGDILSTAGDRLIVMDISLCSKSHFTLEKLEIRKTKEYKFNRNHNPSNFLPLVVTSEGAWGPQMEKYFEKWSGRSSGLDTVDKDFQTTFRYIKQKISLAVCQANWVYMKLVRQGISAPAQRKSGSSSQPTSQGSQDSSLDGNS